MHIHIYTCGFSNEQLCLRDQLHACMRMPHMHRSHIDFLTHSLFGRAERYYFYSGACAFSYSAGINLEPNAIISIQVLALSHRAQVLILSVLHHCGGMQSLVTIQRNSIQECKYELFAELMHWKDVLNR